MHLKFNLNLEKSVSNVLGFLFALNITQYQTINIKKLITSSG